MLEALVTTVAAASAPAIVGLLAWLVKESRLARIAAKNADDTITASILILLRNQMLTNHRSLVETWAVTVGERESFSEMHRLYTALGGNSHVSHLIEDIKKMRVESPGVRNG